MDSSDEQDQDYQEVTVEVFPDTVAEIIYLSDYQILSSDSPIPDTEDTSSEYEIGSVDTAKYPVTDFVLDESGNLVLLASEEDSNTEVINEYGCHQCKFTTTSLKDLEAHEETHADNFICMECMQSFANYNILSKHINDEHTVFLCLVCKTECVGSKFYRTHKRLHELQCEYSCSKCKKDFESDEELMKHMKVHGDLLLYACNICNEAFSKMPELSTHLKTAHPK